jgi:hypothetical protein
VQLSPEGTSLLLCQQKRGFLDFPWEPNNNPVYLPSFKRTDIKLFT